METALRLYRVEREIQKLRQRISEGDDNNRNHSVASDEKSSHGNSPVGHIQSMNSLLPLSDDRYGTPLAGFSLPRFHTETLLLLGPSVKHSDGSLGCTAG